MSINYNYIKIFYLLITLIFITKYSYSNILDIKSSAKQVIIYDHETNEIIFEKNSNEIMKPASMAKVMTAFIVFDKIKDNTLKMSDTFVVSDKAWKMGGSRSFLELNSNVSIKDLLIHNKRICGAAMAVSPMRLIWQIRL